VTHIFGLESAWRTTRLTGPVAHSTGDRANAAVGPVVAAETPTPLLVETMDFAHLLQHESDWTDLARRALERNLFMEPGFVVPFLQHMRPSSDLLFLLAWRKDASRARARLMALWPIIAAKAPGGSYETWRHEYCCLGAPLLDSAEAAACLDAIVSALRADGERIPILSLNQIRRRGPFSSLVSSFAARRGFSVGTVAQYQRAALDAMLPDHIALNSVPSKKRKELRRLSRRLHDRGELSFGAAEAGEALNRQIESFLALEAAGWKGRRGGAFLSRPERAAFARAMLRKLAQEGRCRIYWLACDQNVIASNILLMDGDRAFFWKTAYDEDFSNFSPGVLLTLHMSEALLRDPGLSRIDSCAIPNHPMIDHVWREREPFVDVMLACGPNANAALRRAVLRERFRRWLLDQAKALLTRARRP
jgi:CelD/BcsL family acetyltransferase involved in cellulose biosynthesis